MQVAETMRTEMLRHERTIRTVAARKARGRRRRRCHRHVELFVVAAAARRRRRRDVVGRVHAERRRIDDGGAARDRVLGVEHRQQAIAMHRLWSRQRRWYRRDSERRGQRRSLRVGQREQDLQILDCARGSLSNQPQFGGQNFNFFFFSHFYGFEFV